MASIFEKFRKKEEVVFQSETFLLLQPSAFSRNQYLLAVEECAANDPELKQASQDGVVDTSNVSFKLVAENQKMSLYLIALCCYESLEHKPTFDQCRKELEAFAVDGLIDALYPACENLIFPPAPKDALDPKLDQGNNSHTD